MIDLHHTDCVAWLRDYARLEGRPLFDSAVTDPPYELGFMGKGWDKSGVAFQVETWRAVYDCLKPGAHLFAFSGTRTYHRMACAIEDAGFEIRDQFAWAYGSGFPKNQNVARFIDKQLGIEGGMGAPRSAAHADMLAKGVARRGEKDPGWDRPWMDDPEAIERAQRQYLPGSPQAQEFDGWGTAVKPSWEPILAGSKPVTVEQHFAILIHELTSNFAEIDLCLNSHAPDAARRFSDILAKCEGVASIVLDGAKIRSLESIGVAPSAVRSFTFKQPASLDLIRTRGASALSHVRQSGREDSAAALTIPHGAAADILTQLMGMSTSAMTDGISPSIVSSWLDTSDALLNVASKFTIETAIRLTTALKILSCSLRENITDGTGGLSPNWEPICLARKPLSEPTVAANVLKWGTGALNIDGCRISTDESITATRNISLGSSGSEIFGTANKPGVYQQQPGGRFPANLCHDGSEEVLAGFPDTRDSGNLGGSDRPSMGFHGGAIGDLMPASRNDPGSAARFYYSAKAGPLDRIGTEHTTVKPVDLMRWLCRMATPPGGHILEPFAGSGKTGIAAMVEGFDCTMLELMAEHVADIRRQLAYLRGDGAMRVEEHKRRKDIAKPVNDLPLFGS